MIYKIKKGEYFKQVITNNNRSGFFFKKNKIFNLDNYLKFVKLNNKYLKFVKLKA